MYMYKLSATVSCKCQSMEFETVDYTDEMVIVKKQWKQKETKGEKNRGTTAN